MKFQRFMGGAAAAALCFCSAQASASVLLTSGEFQAGVSDNGVLYDGAVGLSRGGFDVVAGGAPRDSWGLNGYQVDPQNSGVVDGVSSATGDGVVTTTFSDFSVQQTFSFNADGILLVNVEVTNLGWSPADLFFQRNVDWDLDQVSYDQEEVTGSGFSPFIVGITHFGFDDATGAGPYFAGCPDYCGTVGDLGGGLRLNLGSLASGATRKFTYYYGVNATGEDAEGLMNRTFAAGAQYVLTGRSVDGANAATLGVSVAAIPEPSTWAMMLLGFFGLGAAIRRRTAALA